MATRNTTKFRLSFLTFIGIACKINLNVGSTVELDHEYTKGLRADKDDDADNNIDDIQTLVPYFQ